MVVTGDQTGGGKIRLAKDFHVIDGNIVLSAHLFEVSLLRVGTVLRLGEDAK